ncbi:interferon-induced, double-stranded RNA-activated protein kinase [Syngnathus scovelli]|uniref:interferon-induced, double-stranded RNA-activated protein kinase n=1 Tax=Syngnathus scovelli TaxID=161590 RepID=UPI002110E123|nr:interferon-induced, double-stranded RNA-activated protein kinase [Syngnathus scovelli]
MMDTENYVAKLNEYCQKTNSKLIYEDVRSDGPDHIKTFSIRVVVDDEAYPEGVGNNKKEAKKNAAKHALQILMKKTHTSEGSIGPVSQKERNYVSWLYDYGQKIKMGVRFKESARPGPYKSFQCQFFVGEIEYPLSSGITKKEAKEEAAKHAYHAIYEVSATEGENLYGSCNQQKEEMSAISNKTEDDAVVEKNYIGIVNQYCQKRQRTHNFIEVERIGPPHNQKFSCKLVIDGKDYPVGRGKSLKEAKQNAAQLALSVLEKEDNEVLQSPACASSTKSSPNLCKSLATTSSISVEFAESSPKDQITPPKNQSPGCKARRKIAANFPNANRQQIDFKGCEDNRGRNSPSTTSRFKEDFECVQAIGNGSFGSVFKAKHKLDGKHYAVKKVSSEEKSKREIDALSKLQHSNIVRYYTCWIEDSYDQFLYIQMELCDTKTLRGHIDDMNTENKETLQRRDLSFEIIQQIVAGVEYFHDKKLIHRDLKPANILFGLDETVKIGDFGLVTVDSDSEEKSLKTGTLSYMAPEQKDKATYGRKVDIYALGLIYFELLWYMSTSTEREKLWDDVRNQNLPSEFSSNFPIEQQIIKSMLCLRPEDRPEASQLQTNLKECATALKLAKERKTL